MMLPLFQVAEGSDPAGSGLPLTGQVEEAQTNSFNIMSAGDFS